MPDTYAFWTFGALGLLIGFLFTYPMNWALVAIGWKDGQGHEHMLKEMERDKKSDQMSFGNHPGRHRARARKRAMI